MSDLFFQLIETQDGQGLFLWGWLLIMILVFYFWGWRPLSKMKRKITESGKALEDLKRWGEENLEFSADRYRNRRADKSADPTLNPTTRKWLRLFWAGHRQNKPPVVDEVVQREEEYLCRDDEKIRTTSGSLIILGLLGTFVGLYKVILPIKSIIQNTKDNATITDPAAATRIMADMLENIAQSLSGMEFAFITSIAGLGLMIVLNICFSRFSGKRLELIDALETYCNEEIGPRFSLFLPERQLEEAVNNAFKALADRHSEFMAGQEEYIRITLEAHFEKVSSSLEPFFDILNDTSETLNAAVASNQQVSEKWSETLAEFSQQHSVFMADQEAYLKTALGNYFEQVSASLDPLLKTLNDTSETLNAASASNQRVSEKWSETLVEFSQQHSVFMADQGEYLRTALESHFEKMSSSLDPLLKTLNSAGDTLNQGAKDIRESGENFVKHISNFTKLSEPLEKLRIATEKMVADFDERIEALALTMGETYQVLQKLNPDELTYQPVFENIKAQLEAIHATEQELLKFHQVSTGEDMAGLNEKVSSLLQGLSEVESSIKDLQDTLVEKLTGVKQPRNDSPKFLPNIDDTVRSPDERSKEPIVNSSEEMDDTRRSQDGHPMWYKRLTDKLKYFFDRWYMM